MQSDGSFAYPLPAVVTSSNGKRHLVISDCYKHLGGYVTCTGNTLKEARHRAASAMSSFGSTSILLRHELLLGWSLIISKLCYTMHTLGLIFLGLLDALSTLFI